MNQKMTFTYREAINNSQESQLCDFKNLNLVYYFFFRTQTFIYTVLRTTKETITWTMLHTFQFQKFRFS